MQVLTKAEVDANITLYKRKFQETVFIYPTDTIYGIGCDARNGILIDKIRVLKERKEMPFSIIAPSKQWIYDNCIVHPKAEEWIEKLPGPYTLILRVKDRVEFPQSLTQGKKTIGVRIPNHWISSCVEKMGTPIITTSANRTGQNHMEDVDDIPVAWRTHVSYLIYEGEKEGTPSMLVHLDEKEPRIQKR